MQKYSKYSQIVLRIGLGLVVLWFGLQQGMHPAQWTSFLPAWTTTLPISQLTFIYLNSWFEICFGILLIAGFYTWIIAGILALHMLGIVLSLGYNAIAVRDAGLTVALAAIFLHGESLWSLDEYFRKKQDVV